MSKTNPARDTFPAVFITHGAAMIIQLCIKLKSPATRTGGVIHVGPLQQFFVMVQENEGAASIAESVGAGPNGMTID